MRTYTRKKPEYQFITGVHVLCRLCLGNSNVSIPIFTEESNCCGLPLRIMICVGLEMTRDDCLPNMICMKCYTELESFYTFRKKCEVTYQKLKSHVLAVKEREQKVLEIKSEQNEIATKKCVSQTNSVTMQHLLFDKNKNMEMPQVEKAKEINRLSNEVSRQTSTDNETQFQESITNNTSTSALDIEAFNSDVSLILSTILMEIGVVQQQNGRLIMVDQNLKTVELEGEGNSKVVLEILEEEEQPTFNHQEVPKPNNVISKDVNNKEQILETNKFQNNVKERGGKGAWCEKCGRTFASRSVLARHQRVHSGERPHACPLCDRRFGQREVMLRHQLVHQEERPFRCEECPRGFTQRGGLRAHRRRHERALALHRCPHCTKVFLHASGLSRHIATHSGRMFVCDYCNQHFLDRSSLLRHIRSAHRPADTRTPHPLTPADTRTPHPLTPADTRTPHPLTLAPVATPCINVSGPSYGETINSED